MTVAPPHKDVLATFQAIEGAFNQAMVSNDVARISECISDDWVLVTPEKGPIGREAILHVIGNGMLAHDSMTKEVLRAKVYGDTAIVTGRGKNTGTFRGEPISADEWITDVYRLSQGRWRCVLTHLSRAD
ncbi:MAG: nuclear transport factor 2 family protein [Burkholderiales bacterium]|nr:nuclear transport factor 2 family protein [Burkholderiales bacterium]